MSKYYVYLHRRKDNNKVFYLGKGTGNRKNRKRRYPTWNKIVNEAGGFISEVIADKLTEDQALDYELNLLLNPKEDWELINKNKTNRNLELPEEVFKEYFMYSEDSPTGLVWLKWNNSRIKKTTKFAGDIAGYIVKDGTGKCYYAVKVKSKSYLVHRIIWSLLKGKIPDKFVINHVDSDGLNNKIDNLTSVSIRANCQQTNKQRNINNGVYKLTTGKYQYYVAKCVDLQGKTIQKLFSVAKFGEESSMEMALSYRKAMIADLNAQGAEYLIN